MSFARLITAALVLALALPLTASAQDRRSPDAADASMQMLVQRDRRAPEPPALVQDLRSPDAREVFAAPVPPARSAPEAPGEFPWLEAAALAAFALVLIGVTRRRRVTARA
jgi:MYXO-CTERM domain-containing protein